MATGLGTRGDGPREQSIIDPITGERKVLMGDLEFPPRKVWMKTFGCQMNYHDSDRILAHLQDLNFKATEELEEADLVLFNTCAVRDLSNNKFYSQLGEIKHAKKKKNGLVVGIGVVSPKLKAVNLSQNISIWTLLLVLMLSTQ